MGIAGSEQVGQLVVEFVDLGGELVDLGGEGFVVGGEFAGRFQIAAGRFQLAIGRHDRRERSEATTDLAGLGGVAVQRGVGELALEVGMLGQQRVDRRRGVRHVGLLPSTQTDARPALARQIGRRDEELFVG